MGKETVENLDTLELGALVVEQSDVVELGNLALALVGGGEGQVAL